MRRCFQCGQRTEAAQLTAVGDGEFCAACFRSLLAAEAEASARREVSPPAAAGSPAALPPRRPSTSRACLVCERSIAGDASVSFLGGDICAECNRQMERELRDGERREAAEQAALAAVPAPTPAAAALGEQGASQPAAFTPGAALVRRLRTSDAGPRQLSHHRG